MKHMMFTVKDRGIGAFGVPFSARARGEAIRSFMEACSDPKLPFGRHPNDYSLYFVGEFEDLDGSYRTPEEGPILIITADEVVRNASLDVSGQAEPFTRS